MQSYIIDRAFRKIKAKNTAFYWILPYILPVRVLEELSLLKMIKPVSRVHGIQIDRLNLTVSMQKSVLKNRLPIPRYYSKGVKI